jgi:hypothetical protein
MMKEITEMAQSQLTKEKTQEQLKQGTETSAHAQSFLISSVFFY